MNEELSQEALPAAPPDVVPEPVNEAAAQQPVVEEKPSGPPPKDPRRRLRELLAIPDSQRSEPEWDELIELEISLAPGNRINPAPQGGSDPNLRQDRNRRPEQTRRPDQGPRLDQTGGPGAKPGLKPGKRFFKKPKRPPGAPPKVG